MALAENDLIHLNRTGEQLKSAIRNLIGEMPAQAQSIAGMAKWLNANKSTCQRMLNVMNKPQDGLDVIQLLPGFEGINQFIDCAQAQQIDSLLIQEARKASQSFNNDIQLFGRSHSQLKRKLAELKDPQQVHHSMSEAENNRRAHFQASQQLLGESSDLTFATFIAQPNKRDDKHYHEFAIVSRQQVSIKKQARPFMQFYSKDALPFSTQPSNNIDTSAMVEQFDLGIVDRFSSIDLREAYSGYSQASASLVFSNMSNSENPFDATFLFNSPQEAENPLNSQFKTTTHSISIKIPAKRLVMLVFLDKRYDIRSTVNVGCYPASTQVERAKHTYDEIWNDRFPEFPDLKILNSLTSVSEKTGINKADDMIQYLFDYAQLSQDDFVCYMIDVNYPIWSSTYRIYFEFA
jgi:hypothetical protein